MASQHTMPMCCAVAVTNSTDGLGSACPALICMLQLVLLEADSRCILSLHPITTGTLVCLLNFSGLASLFHSAHVVDTADDSEQEEELDSPLMQLHPTYQPGQSHAFAPAADKSVQPSRVAHISSQKPPFSSGHSHSQSSVSGKLSQLLACPYCLHLACCRVVQATKHTRLIRAAPLRVPGVEPFPEVHTAA